jgi:hypothetical protein
MLLKRLSIPEDQGSRPSTCSSMSAFKGTLHQPVASPSHTPSEIDADLAHFPLSPSDSTAHQYELLKAINPPEEQINGTITLCHAILRYQQRHPELL